MAHKTHIISARSQVLWVKPRHGLCSIHDVIIIIHGLVREVTLGVEGDVVNGPLGMTAGTETLEGLLVEIACSPLPVYYKARMI